MQSIIYQRNKHLKINNVKKYKEIIIVINHIGILSIMWEMSIES